MTLRYINPSTSITRNFTKIPNFLLNNSLKLTDIQRSFYFFIWSRVFAHIGYAEISLADVKRALGYSKTKTLRVRNELVNLGLIDIASTKNYNGSCGKTRYYLKNITNPVQNFKQKDCEKFDTPFKETNLEQEKFKENIQQSKKESNNDVDVISSCVKSNIISQLHELKINNKIINELTERYSSETLKMYIDYTNSMMKKNKVSNQAAFFYSAITEGYDLSTFVDEREKDNIKINEEKIKKEEEKIAAEEDRKIEKERIEIKKAWELYEMLDENAKARFEQYLEDEINSRFGNPHFGRKAFKSIIIREQAIKCQWDFKSMVKPA